MDDPKITVRWVRNDGELLATAPEAQGHAPVTLRPDIMNPLREVVTEMWNVPVVPSMNTGASDGVYTDAAGMPTYGVTAVGIDTNDIRAHGKDERIRTEAYYQGVDFYYRYLKALTGGNGAASKAQ